VALLKISRSECRFRVKMKILKKYSRKLISFALVMTILSAASAAAAPEQLAKQILETCNVKGPVDISMTDGRLLCMKKK